MSFTWPVDRTCLPPLPDLGDEPTEEDQAAYFAAVADRNAAEDTAIAVLWALSGRQFGVETTTIRPCPPLGWPNTVYTSCPCIGRCRHASPTQIHLPGPVAAPTEDDPLVVTIAGVVLDSAEYVLEGDVLYRRNGARWPSQNLARPLGETGTWSVTYRKGWPVPPGVDRLTGALAKEFLAACAGDDSCRLPRTLTGTTRRGVSHSFDPAKIFAAGRTGLTEVDNWLAAVNPNHLASGPEVL